MIPIDTGKIPIDTGQIPLECYTVHYTAEIFLPVQPTLVTTKADGPTDFLSPVLFVPKPRQLDRLQTCMDIRRLNKVCKRDYNALLHIRDLLNNMFGCKYFTAFDLTCGFWALVVEEGDQQNTTFTVKGGSKAISLKSKKR
jgi:hypothetical protein